MGVSHSGHPRSVNLENATPVGVVEVSEDVVKRLKSGLGKEKQIAAPPSVPMPAEDHIKIENQAPVKPPPPVPSTAPPVLYIDAGISSIEARRQKEQELSKLDMYWRNRMNQLEQNLNKTNKIMEEDYATAIENVKKSFAASPLYSGDRLNSLQGIKTQLIACYNVNKGQPLNCAEEVTAFTNSVDKYRIMQLEPEAGDGITVKSAGNTSKQSKPVKAA